jgi:hypothetical protein
MNRQERIALRKKRVEERNKRKEAEQKDVITSAAPTSDPSILPEKLTIEICIHCFNYQKRLDWMLSSVLQQKGNVPNIIINISHCPNNGNPSTESVISLFREKGLNIKETMLTEQEMSNRAIARNRQATETTADYILFSDSDLVYSEEFFEDLQKNIKEKYRDINVVMGADRFSLDDQFCIKWFEQDKRDYPCIIENVANIVSTWKVKWKRGKGTAPGFFQLVKVKILKEKGGGLVTGRAKDHWRRTIADRALRIRLGGRIGIDTKPMYHLNHDRGGPELQR